MKPMLRRSHRTAARPLPHHRHLVQRRPRCRGLAHRWWRGLRGDERGDVPGWVLVTLMTAGLVVALWTVAGSTLTQVFLDAIAKVTGAI